jgi:hypothetical protein
MIKPIFLKLGHKTQGNVLHGSMVLLFLIYFFWLENDVTNLAQKFEIHCMTKRIILFKRHFYGELETESSANFEIINQKI